MTLKLFTEIEDGKIKISPSINDRYSKINFSKFFEFENMILYESDEEKNIDFNELYKNIAVFRKKIFEELNIKINSKISYMLYADKEDDCTPYYDFIKRNKDLPIFLKLEDFKEAVDNLGFNDYPNLKILFNQTEEYVTYKEFLKMYNDLDKVIKFVEYYNLSPLERVTLVYDIVKSNKYSEEGLDESYGTSRYLNKIINNDKMVCLGFANLMDYLLNNLGISCKKVKLSYENKRTGHARNYVILKDDKYNIDGAFFMDATWDCKRKQQYLDNYLFFLRPFNYFKNFRKTEKIKSPKKFQILEKSIKDLYSSPNEINRQDIISLQAALIQLILEIENPEFKNISLVGGETKIQVANVKKVLKYYNQSISKEAFKCAIYKVRKIEYINGIISNMPNEEELNNLCNKYSLGINKIDWDILFNEDKPPKINKIFEETKSKTIEEDILKTRLIKNLKQISGDKPKIKYISKM